MKIQYLLVTVLFLFISCTSQNDSSTFTETKKLGNEISDKAQTVLLKNVAQAIQKEGVPYAVAFCNLNANTLIDSLNQEFSCAISRISDKNRNPNAGLGSQKEKELWQVFLEGERSDTLVQNSKHFVFYKPIRIALPACLKCHGNSDTDINVETQKKLQDLYPKDLATGYHLNDFRGLWKIEFEIKGIKKGKL